MTDSDILDRGALDRLREWGGERLLAQMVQLFLENAPVRMTQIRDGLQGADLKQVEQGAHSLKSSAANLGAEAVRALAAEIERAASGGDRAAAESGFLKLEEEFTRAIRALKAVEAGSDA